MKHIGQVRLERKLPVERYRFPKQETDVRRGDKVCQGEMAIGKVEEIDITSRTIVIKKTNKSAGTHPTAIFVDGRGPKWEVLADALFALGEWARGKEMDSPGPHRAARDLLLRSSPRLEGKEKVAPLPGETPVETACRIVTALNDSVFAIQGPPGAGKTHTAAWMICRLVSMGKKIGITALSHKVIRNVLEKVLVVADELEMKGIRCVQKAKEDGEDTEAAEIIIAKTNQDALLALQSGRAQVGAGTVWMWARPEFANAVDVLLIDEAGQMAVADVLAAARSAKKLVLIGDPQQLQRPLKGSHPDGAEKSALQHQIGEHKTIADGMGLLLPETWRMHPKVCEFTSEMFYEGKLGTRPVTRPRVLEGHAWVKDAGIWFVPLQHTGNRNCSAEEVEKIAEIVASLLKPGVKWFCSGLFSAWNLRLCKVKRGADVPENESHRLSSNSKEPENCPRTGVQECGLSTLGRLSALKTNNLLIPLSVSYSGFKGGFFFFRSPSSLSFSVSLRGLRGKFFFLPLQFHHGLLHSGSNNRGLPTTITAVIAREVATLNLFKLYKNSIPRGASSGVDVVSE